MPDTITELAGLPRIVRIRAHEAFLLILCVLVGIGGIVQPLAASVDVLLPRWFAWIWYVGLIVGALLGLAGMWIHSPTGPLIERAGLRLLNGIGVTYAAVVLYAAGAQGLFTGLSVILFVAFNVLRLVQIRFSLAAERAVLLTMRQINDPDDPGSQP